MQAHDFVAASEPFNMRAHDGSMSSARALPACLREAGRQPRFESQGMPALDGCQICGRRSRGREGEERGSE
eukprot:359243-Chlamydomonas_euryale.AAC.2